MREKTVQVEPKRVRSSALVSRKIGSGEPGTDGEEPPWGPNGAPKYLT